MGILTQISGIIRVDGNLDKVLEALEKPVAYCIKGEPEEYTDYVQIVDRNREYSNSDYVISCVVWKDRPENFTHQSAVFVFGDLRSFSNVNEIIRWFSDAVGKSDIRQANIIVECDDGDKAVWCYNENESGDYN